MENQVLTECHRTLDNAEVNIVVSNEGFLYIVEGLQCLLLQRVYEDEKYTIEDVIPVFDLLRPMLPVAKEVHAAMQDCVFNTTK